MWRGRSFSKVWHQAWKNSRDKFSITISYPDVEILTMTGAGLVFSATPEKMAAMCFIPTILIYLQWDELELRTKQRQVNPEGHCCTSRPLWCTVLNRREIAKRTFTLRFSSGEHEEDVASAPNAICRCDTFPLALRYPLPSPEFWHVARGTPTTPTGSQQRDAV